MHDVDVDFACMVLRGSLTRRFTCRRFTHTRFTHTFSPFIFPSAHFCTVHAVSDSLQACSLHVMDILHGALDGHACERAGKKYVKNECN